MLRKPFFLLCLLFFVAVDRSDAQAVPVSTWSARSSSGLNLLGTWTVVPDTARGIATGTWTLVDAQGNTVTGGAWSASKSPAGWDGSWRAVIGTTAEHFGTWSSSIDLQANASFAEMFEKSLHTFVSGDWRYSAYSGTWTIRAFK